CPSGWWYLLSSVWSWFSHRAGGQGVAIQGLIPFPCPAGLWALEEKRELSTPLCLAARHGHPDCLRHLLRHGADPNLAPGGRGPLHEACQGEHSHCLELLLEYRADPNLWRSPLHRACGAANAELVRLLLRRGADANAADYDGVSPLGWALQSAASHRDLRPHLTIQLLAVSVPGCLTHLGFFPASLSSSSLNTSSSSGSWEKTQPRWVMLALPLSLQQHQPFYESILRLAGTARCLQHLCRSAIRANFGSRCHSLIPLLPVPKALRDFLLLEPQGVVL
uniref:Ankyrin repeat and SOCS box containing 18 n=1 Tax=Cyanistes caeruleus TaxID=156563 RepID=A0A8C0TXW4_CYACU